VTVALAHYDAGLNVVPPREDGSKQPDLQTWTEYQDKRLSRERVAQLYRAGRAGIGWFTGEGSGNLEVLEFEEQTPYDAYKTQAADWDLVELVERIEAGYLSASPGGGFHWPYRCTEIGGNTKLARRPKELHERKDENDSVKTLIETRGSGGFIIEPPSGGPVHETGRPYRLMRGRPETIVTITPDEREALHALARTFDQMPRAEATPQRRDLPLGGTRPGDDFNARMTWADVLEPHGWQFHHESGGEGFWTRPGKDRRLGISATTNYKGSGLLYVFSSSTPFDPEQSYSKFAAHAVLEHGGSFTEAARALASTGHGAQAMSVAPDNPAWPAPLDTAAFHGLAGDVVAAIRTHTEADDAALLANFLAAFGNVVGRAPHAVAEADRHGGNLFAVLVGATAKGRKGSSWGHIRELFTRADPTWAADHIAQGLSSGEGVIWAVRDAIERTVPVKERGRATGEYETTVEDVGVADKRLLILESEFASVLKVMAREGNTLSPVLRSAWDTGDMRTLTKNSPARATGAHVSILGHITQGELLRYLNDTEAGNGFANRFLWFCTQRARMLPEGGGNPDYSPLVHRLHGALEHGRKTGRLERDVQARRLWAEVYPELSEGKPGLLGAVIARAEAQVLRLSLLYSVLDGADVILPAHLKAALAVWEYCEASARYIFGDATGDPIADQILRALRTSGELTRTSISGLLGRNVAAARIEHALRTLEKANVARSLMRPPSEAGGRPAEVWVLSSDSFVS